MKNIISGDFNREKIRTHLVPNEKVLFLYSGKYKRKYAKYYMILPVGGIFFLILSLLNTFLNNYWSLLDIGLIIGIIFLVSLAIKVNIPEKYLLLLTNKKIYYIYKWSIYPEVYSSVNLADISALGYKTHKNQKSGTLYLISNKLISHSDSWKLTIRNLNKFKEKFHKIESILWHYGNLQERWNKIKGDKDNFFPYKIKTRNHLLILKRDEINILEGNRQINIKFQDDFNLKFGSYPDEITFSFNSNSKKVVIGAKDFFKNCRLIYLTFCLWKDSKNLFLPEDKISKISL